MEVPDEIAEVLPALPEEFTLSHIISKKHKCRRLVYRKPAYLNAPQETDRVVNHLFKLSYDGLDIFALEAFVYESKINDKKITTLFISKADTTGHYYQAQKISIVDVTTAIMRVLLRHHVETEACDLVRVCLFAKAARQYLFPLSSENPKKHILWDAALVKWWCKAVEPLRDEFDGDLKAKLQIPGSDERAIRACFPANSTLPWQVGDLFWDDNVPEKLPEAAAVLCIPRFDDDPKVRFLEDLVKEKRAKKVSRSRFWLELQGRQEFRQGSLVGIIGIEGRPRTQRVAKAGPKPMSYRDYKAIKYLMISTDFSTEAFAREGYELLERKIPPTAICQIRGRRKDNPLKRKAEDAPAVNVLNASFVRKKPKK